MAVKNYVLDTNVLLHDARAFYAFADNNVVIPIFVIEEIDTFKKDQNELGRNARQVARLLDQYRADGGLSKAQPLPNGGTVRVVLGKNIKGNPSYDSRSMDQRILELALEVRDADRANPTILVTKDVNMRIRGDALGLATADFDPEQITIEELYAGNREVTVPSSVIDALYADGSAKLDVPDMHANEFITLKDDHGKSALTRFDKTADKVVPVKKLREGVWGIKPRNREQHFALDQPRAQRRHQAGHARRQGRHRQDVARDRGRPAEGHRGAGLFESCSCRARSFRSAATSAICRVRRHRREAESVDAADLHDNLELLLGPQQDRQGKTAAATPSCVDLRVRVRRSSRSRLHPRSLAAERGYMIVDEAQNLTPHEVKTIITRAGEGTKIILTGDPYQIDHPYLDASNNGLTTVAERFKQEALAGHVILTKGERSPLAELATQIL